MPFGDVTKFRAKSREREEDAWVLGCRPPTPFNITCHPHVNNNLGHLEHIAHPSPPKNQGWKMAHFSLRATSSLNFFGVSVPCYSVQDCSNNVGTLLVNRLLTYLLTTY